MLMTKEVCSDIWSLMYMFCHSLYLVFEVLIHSFIVHLLIMNNNIVICNYQYMVSTM